jgi:SAM-dependent methyltransferase
MLTELINKFYINTIDIGSKGKTFLFVKNLDKTNGFKLSNNSKLPFKNNSIKAIYCSHVVEHLFEETIVNLLNEIDRVLQKGGVFRIATINFKKLHNLLTKNEIDALLDMSIFRGRPEWEKYNIKFSYVKYVTHFFSNYQNRAYERSPEFGYNSEGFYRGPPNIDDTLVKEMANKLTTREFGKWLVNQIPKKFINNGGHVNPVTIEYINEIKKSLKFSDKEFCNSSSNKLVKMEKFYNLKRKKISVFFEANKL